MISVGYDSLICIWEITDRSVATKQVAQGATGITVYPSLRNSVLTSSSEPVSGDELLCVLYDGVRGNSIVGGNNSIIQLWSFSSLDRRGHLAGHEDSVCALAQDQNFLFSGSEDKKILVWDLESLICLYTLVGHSQGITALLIVPESGHLLSCAHDGNLLIWAASGCEPVKTVKREDSLNCLSFLNNENVILVGTERGTIITVPIEPRYGNPSGVDNTIDKAQEHINQKLRERREESKFPSEEDV